MTRKPFIRSPHRMHHLRLPLLRLILQTLDLLLQCLVHIRPLFLLSIMFFAFAFPFGSESLSLLFVFFIFIGDDALQFVKLEFLVFQESYHFFPLLFLLIDLFLDVFCTLANFIKFLFHLAFKHLSFLHLSL